MQKTRFRRTVAGTAIAAAFAASVAGAAVAAGAWSPPQASPLQHAQGSLPPAAPLAVAPTRIAEVVAAAGPAVVNVSVRGVTPTAAALPPGIDRDDPFFDYFRRFMPPRAPLPSMGQGSGFIVSADGLVLTNAHVVANATEVTVRLTDRREFPATVVGVDRATDIAVLRIDGQGLPTVRLGDPSQVHVGDWVVAIGAPFGFDNSVTAGIVSAKGRSLPDQNYVPFLQTDVAVNPGNSGGPLLNMAGEVIGINSQIYSRSGGYQGLSFAIPIDVAQRVQQQLVSEGHVSRGRLGVSIQELDQSLAKAFGLDRPTGALVSDIQADGPAARAGMRAGDVILSVDGREITRAGALPPLIAALEPGSTVRIEVWRERERRELTVGIGAVAGAEAVAERPHDQGTDPALGLTVRPQGAAEGRAANGEAGLVVESVRGPAARAGVRPGDLVLALNGRPVHSAEALRAELARAGDRVALLIERDGARLFVPVELG